MTKGRLPDGLWLRGKTYYACVQVDGKRVRRKLSDSLAEAKRLLAGIRAELHERPVIVSGAATAGESCADEGRTGTLRPEPTPHRHPNRHPADALF